MKNLEKMGDMNLNKKAKTYNNKKIVYIAGDSKFVNSLKQEYLNKNVEIVNLNTIEGVKRYEELNKK